MKSRGTMRGEARRTQVQGCPTRWAVRRRALKAAVWRLYLLLNACTKTLFVEEMSCATGLSYARSNIDRPHSPHEMLTVASLSDANDSQHIGHSIARRIPRSCSLLVRDGDVGKKVEVRVQEDTIRVL